MGKLYSRKLLPGCWQERPQSPTPASQQARALKSSQQRTRTRASVLSVMYMRTGTSHTSHTKLHCSFKPLLSFQVDGVALVALTDPGSTDEHGSTSDTSLASLGKLAGSSSYSSREALHTK